MTDFEDTSAHSVFRTRESLLKKLKAGADQEAWEEFYALYGRLIFGYALHYSITHAEAEDIVQEVCIKVFRQINRFEYAPDRGRFRGWLKTITRHAVIDHIRRTQSRRKQSADYRRHIEHELVEGNARDEEVWVQEWEKALYEAALQRVRKRVGEETYDVFQRYVVGGRTAAEVADETALDANAVYAVKHRVLRYIREEVDELIEQDTDAGENR